MSVSRLLVLPNHNLLTGQKESKVKDRIVAIHLKRVTGKQSMIQEQKFLIGVTDHDNQNRQLYLQELRTLQKETFAKEQIIENEVAEELNRTMSTS